MSGSPRIGTALSAVALAALLSGCAMPGSKGAAFQSAKAPGELGLATRAHFAIEAGDYVTAIGLAERAAEKNARDATVRALLGNAYFGAGRFASAETSYRDSLGLNPNQPGISLKLALVQIAQGKTGEALAFLETARTMLDAADYGLALALAGQPYEAIPVLEQAARLPEADSRVRQNLALAHGLAGDWTAARTIAAQDLSADLVDSRVQQWMTLAKPARASDQVAALTGITPAAEDPGQPVRLALADSDNRLAQLQTQLPQPAAVAYPAETLQVAEEQSASLASDYAAPQMAAAFEAPVAEQVVAAPVTVPALAEESAPPPLVAAIAPSVDRTTRKVARGDGASVVVQLGAYSSATRVETAWEQVAAEHGTLRDYTPTSAKFASSRGTVYRLSVKGFANLGEATRLCSELRSRGQNCFVRRVAGDSPVQFASR